MRVRYQERDRLSDPNLQRRAPAGCPWSQPRAQRRYLAQPKLVAVYCHGVSALIDAKLFDGNYLITGKTITGFSNAEEDHSLAYVGSKVTPRRIEDAAIERDANYVQGGLFKAFVVRDGRLITGQQQYSGRRSHSS